MSIAVAYHVFPHSLPLIDQAQAFTALPLLHSQLAGAHGRLGPLPLLLLCLLSLHMQTAFSVSWQQMQL